MWIHGVIVFLCCLAVHGREECEPGKYGDKCTQTCSPDCKPLPNSAVPCDRETGECFEGCKVGVYSDRCDQPCNRNCKDLTCNQHNGYCTLGCIENYIGDFCETPQEITIVQQGTTDSNHTTVTTVLAPIYNHVVAIGVVVLHLIIILLALIYFICRRKVKNMLMSIMRKRSGSQSSESSVLYTARDTMKDDDDEEFLDTEGPVTETEESGRREKLRGSSLGDTATPTPACRDIRADADLLLDSWEGNLAEVERILDTGRADINCRGWYEKTPVMEAACEGRRDVVEFLVSRGADVSLVDEDGRNVLHWACMGGDRRTVEFVLSLDGVDINSSKKGSWTPVMAAATRGHRHVVELLVSRGADVSLVDDDRNNILHWACGGGDRKTVEFVLSQGWVDINSRGLFSSTPVMWAAQQGHRHVVKHLVSRGAYVSLVDDGGNNILHSACLGGDRKTVEFVLALNVVDVNSRGERSSAPVIWAAQRGHRHVVEFLVSRGADVSLVDDDGNNILHYACAGGDRKIVEFVLSLDGVDVNARNSNGESAVNMARRKRHPQLVDLMVSRGTQ